MAISAGMSCLSSCALGRGGASSFAGRERRAAETPDGQQQGSEPESASAEEDRFGFDAERIVARHQGREGWTREAHRQLEQHRWKLDLRSDSPISVAVKLPLLG